MSRSVVITQSNYLPWKGYFDSIALADDFVLLDTVQFTKRDWRNRNIIKTPQGLKWLSVPVMVKGKFLQSINQTMVADDQWRNQHWKTIKQNYSKAPFFKNYESVFEAFFLAPPSTQHLSAINLQLIKIICNILGIQTRIHLASDFATVDDKNMRLIQICQALGATDYHSGPTARSYLDVGLFEKHAIKSHFFDYSGYQPYPQAYGEFVHEVSVLDLIFNVGPAAFQYMKYLKRDGRELIQTLPTAG